MIGTATANVISNKTGNYIKKPLEQGNYKMTITLDGYETIVINPGNVKLGQITKQNFALVAG